MCCIVLCIYTTRKEFIIKGLTKTEFTCRRKRWHRDLWESFFPAGVALFFDRFFKRTNRIEIDRLITTLVLCFGVVRFFFRFSFLLVKSTAELPERVRIESLVHMAAVRIRKCLNSDLRRMTLRNCWIILRSVPQLRTTPVERWACYLEMAAVRFQTLQGVLSVFTLLWVSTFLSDRFFFPLVRIMVYSYRHQCLSHRRVAI